MAINDFTHRYSLLNDAQRKAVDTTEGPILVIAGPGTGKTELLTLRVANILLKTDAQPENILCLTFTESAAYEMRQRLVNLIGQQAYNVTISTYHAFGKELIARYPDYFDDKNELNAIDELGQYNIVKSIIEKLPFDNPFKRSEDQIRDILNVISDCKRALLQPNDIKNIAEDNLLFIKTVNPIISATLDGIVRISSNSVKSFTELYKKLSPITTNPIKQHLIPISTLCHKELQDALEIVRVTNKTTALTNWKNSWLERNKSAQFVLSGELTNKKLLALADIYKQYLSILVSHSFFDYDDMILRAIHGLQQHTEFKYSLQERYLYMLLDEFQDTNGAQFELIKLLTDSPIHEGKPNIMAVGDDDQAIYAFQGANYSHMLAFKQKFKEVLIVSLTENYRSHSDVLHVAHNISNQIESRLHFHLNEIDKTITARSKSVPKAATIARHEFKSDVAQYGWVTEKINHLIASGTSPSQIAILAPQHKYLEPIIPYLRQAKIPVRYEKREDVLSDPNIVQLLRMAELVIALKNNAMQEAQSLWPEVLSYDFWQLSTESIWDLSWNAFDTGKDWTKLLIQQDWGRTIGLFFVQLGNLAKVETLETMLDYLIGTSGVIIDNMEYQSPYYEYHFSKDRQATGATDFWSLLSNLTVLRQHLREHQTNDNTQLSLENFVEFSQQHKQANIKVLNTSPYHEASDSIQVMTAYKSKGLEFDYVFVLATLDDVWGSKAKNQPTRIPLPPNLSFIRYKGGSDDERLRLFFVALTRAKFGLYLTSYENNYANRPTSRLKYLEEIEYDDVVTSTMLPSHSQRVVRSDTSSPRVSDLLAYWQQRHALAASQAPLQQLLKPRLDRYQIAPTHINSFIDTKYGGPEYFFLNTILRFPKSPTVDGEFGNVIHETLEWIHIQQRLHHKIPTIAKTILTFNEKLSRRNMSNQNYQLLVDRGARAITAYMKQNTEQFNESDEHEFNFKQQGVFVGKAHMSGKIDKMIIDKKLRTITVVDYKTGKGYTKWAQDSKLHKYKQQLYMYKLLVEGSYQFADYTVTKGILEFVEPDYEGKVTRLEMSFEQDELAKTKKLIIAVWSHILELNFPEIKTYSKDLKGTLAFEEDLISKKV